MSRGPTIVGPNLHDSGPIDFDHDGRVSHGELALAVVLGCSAFTAAVTLGALLVLWACG